MKRIEIVVFLLLVWSLILQFIITQSSCYDSSLKWGLFITAVVMYGLYFMQKCCFAEDEDNGYPPSSSSPLVNNSV